MKKWLRGNLRYALSGIGCLFRTQVSARIQLGVAVLVIGAGFAFGIEAGEWIAVILAMGLVFGAEALNTALESLADAVHPEPDPLVGRAKDLAAGAVLLTVIAAVAIGAIVFFPRILSWLIPPH